MRRPAPAAGTSSGPKKVLCLVGTLDVGGAEGQIMEMCRALAGRFEFHVATSWPGGELEEEIRRTGARLHSLRRRRTETRGSRFLRAVRLIVSATRLRRLLDRVRPDLIHAFLFEMSVLAAIARWPHRSPPLIVSRRSLEEWIARERLYLPLARWSNRQADLFLCNSEAVLRDAVQKEGLAPARTVVLHNCVDTRRFGPGPADPEQYRELGIPSGVPVVTMVANLHRYKGHADVVEAMAQLAKRGLDFVLLFVGRDGNASEDLRVQVRQRNLSGKVIFAGLRSSVPEILRLTDVFVSASHEEGFSNSILEAMASGKAIVATAVGGTPEQIESERTGILVPPKSPPSLAEAIGRLLEDPDLRTRLGIAAREAALERFSVPTLMAELERIYDSLIARQQRAV